MLVEVHRAVGEDRRIADEFLACFLLEVRRAGELSLRPALARHLDGEDLVQSVLGDLWPEIAGLRFEGRRAFLAYLRQRLRWKASDHARRLEALRRAGGRREARPTEELAVEDDSPSPATRTAELDEHERLALVLLRLPDDARELLRRNLRGDSHAEIAADSDRTPEQVRKAVHRALRRARALLPPPPE